MKTAGRMLSLGLLLLACAARAAQPPGATMAFTLSMENPSNHLYHVVFRCAGLRGETQDFKMPVWTPGYYAILNFAKNVENFQAQDGAGKTLPWEKATTNTWRVRTTNATMIKLSYDVRATTAFVGNLFLDERRGFFNPAGVFLHVAGRIQNPATLTIVPNTNWSTIATGLEPVTGQSNTYYAPDFDVLYDCPFLMGNLKAFPAFEIRGVPHNFVAYNPGEADYAQFMKDLKPVIEAGIAVIGEIPYSHYTFLAIGPGAGGGLEHLNSTAVSFSGNSLNSRTRRNSSLNLLAHEYFHNFNVKRIRPIELGPFDYDNGSRTRMLWVSEGLTSYYADLMLARSGMANLEETLETFRRHIVACENRTGHLFQSVTEASWDVWTQGQGTGGNRNTNRVNKTISYYDKGAALGLLLDFKIRNETRNRKSLDTVMRTLYREYFQKKERGWTEAEFRAVCEDTAGVRLGEFFDYVYTTRDIDYKKYLGYAGLELEPARRLDIAELGVAIEDQEGKLIIGAVMGNSAAQFARLAAGDEIRMLDGVTVDSRKLIETIAAKKPGDEINLAVTQGGKERNVAVTLRNRLERSYRMMPVAAPTALQTAILKDWMGEK